MLRFRSEDSRREALREETSKERLEEAVESIFKEALNLFQGGELEAAESRFEALLCNPLLRESAKANGGGKREQEPSKNKSGYILQLATRNAAELAEKMGKTDLAWQRYSRAVELDSSDVETWVRAARLCFQSGALVLARHCLISACHRDEERLEPRICLSLLSCWLKDWQSAYGHAMLALIHNPSSVEARVLYAVSSERANVKPNTLSRNRRLGSTLADNTAVPVEKNCGVEWKTIIEANQLDMKGAWPDKSLAEPMIVKLPDQTLSSLIESLVEFITPSRVPRGRPAFDDAETAALSVAGCLRVQFDIVDKRHPEGEVEKLLAKPLSHLSDIGSDASKKIVSVVSTAPEATHGTSSGYGPSTQNSPLRAADRAGQINTSSSKRRADTASEEPTKRQSKRIKNLKESTASARSYEGTILDRASEPHLLDQFLAIVRGCPDATSEHADMLDSAKKSQPVRSTELLATDTKSSDRKHLRCAVGSTSSTIKENSDDDHAEAKHVADLVAKCGAATSRNSCDAINTLFEAIAFALEWARHGKDSVEADLLFKAWSLLKRTRGTHHVAASERRKGPSDPSAADATIRRCRVWIAMAELAVSLEDDQRPGSIHCAEIAISDWLVEFRLAVGMFGRDVLTTETLMRHHWLLAAHARNRRLNREALEWLKECRRLRAELQEVQVSTTAPLGMNTDRYISMESIDLVESKLREIDNQQQLKDLHETIACMVSRKASTMPDSVRDDRDCAYKWSSIDANSTCWPASFHTDQVVDAARFNADLHPHGIQLEALFRKGCSLIDHWLGGATDPAWRGPSALGASDCANLALDIVLDWAELIPKVSRERNHTCASPDLRVSSQPFEVGTTSSDTLLQRVQPCTESLEIIFYPVAVTVLSRVLMAFAASASQAANANTAEVLHSSDSPTSPLDTKRVNNSLKCLCEILSHSRDKEFLFAGRLDAKQRLKDALCKLIKSPEGIKGSKKTSVVGVVWALCELTNNNWGESGWHRSEIADSTAGQQQPCMWDLAWRLVWQIGGEECALGTGFITSYCRWVSIQPQVRDWASFPQPRFAWDDWEDDSIDGSRIASSVGNRAAKRKAHSKAEESHFNCDSQESQESEEEIDEDEPRTLALEALLRIHLRVDEGSVSAASSTSRSEDSFERLRGILRDDVRNPASVWHLLRPFVVDGVGRRSASSHTSSAVVRDVFCTLTSELIQILPRSMLVIEPWASLCKSHIEDWVVKWPAHLPVLEPPKLCSLNNVKPPKHLTPQQVACDAALTLAYAVHAAAPLSLKEVEYDPWPTEAKHALTCLSRALALDEDGIYRARCTFAFADLANATSRLMHDAESEFGYGTGEARSVNGHNLSDVGAWNGLSSSSTRRLADWAYRSLLPRPRKSTKMGRSSPINTGSNFTVDDRACDKVNEILTVAMVDETHPPHLIQLKASKNLAMMLLDYVDNHSGPLAAKSAFRSVFEASEMLGLVCHERPTCAVSHLCLAWATEMAGFARMHMQSSGIGIQQDEGCAVELSPDSNAWEAVHGLYRRARQLASAQGLVEICAEADFRRICLDVSLAEARITLRTRSSGDAMTTASLPVVATVLCDSLLSQLDRFKEENPEMVLPYRVRLQKCRVLCMTGCTKSRLEVFEGATSKLFYAQKIQRGTGQTLFKVWENYSLRDKRFGGFSVKKKQQDGFFAKLVVRQVIFQRLSNLAHESFGKFLFVNRDWDVACALLNKIRDHKAMQGTWECLMVGFLDAVSVSYPCDGEQGVLQSIVKGTDGFGPNEGKRALDQGGDEVESSEGDSRLQTLWSHLCEMAHWAMRSKRDIHPELLNDITRKQKVLAVRVYNLWWNADSFGTNSPRLSSSNRSALCASFLSNAGSKAGMGQSIDDDSVQVDFDSVFALYMNKNPRSKLRLGGKKKKKKPLAANEDTAKKTKPFPKEQDRVNTHNGEDLGPAKENNSIACQS